MAISFRCLLAGRLLANSYKLIAQLIFRSKYTQKGTPNWAVTKPTGSPAGS